MRHIYTQSFLSKVLLTSLFLLMTQLGLFAQSPLYVTHWTSSSDPDWSSGSAGTVSTVTIDTACSQVNIRVTDTANSPLPAYNAYQLNPIDSMGNDVTDLSGNMRIYVRARSKASVQLGLLLRSGGGGSSERSNRIEFTVPGDTSNWTDLVFEFTPSTLAGFDSTDLRDFWFYLDRGVTNFAGNDFYMDYVSIGAAPDTALNSTCASDTTMGPDPVDPIQYTLHWESSATPLFSGSGAATLNQVVDTACSQLNLSVADPVNNPLDDFAALIINPLDTAGNDIVDISGSTQFHVRVRSRDTVSLGFLARSGDGTSSNRSSLQEQIVPGDTLNWTELTFSLDAGNIGGFDSTDLRDFWFYLDRGDDNFAGNDVYFDYIAMGSQPDPADNSACSLTPPFEFPYTLHWADTLDGVFSGSGAAQLTQTIDPACSQLSISVTDPAGDPHPAFRPLIVNPKDELGNDITDLSGQMTFYVRVRSAEAVDLGMLLRAGGGSTSERTEPVEQVVPGDLGKWTELVYTFKGTDYAGFDSTDLRDFWFYLNREEANFPGNEIYFDYVYIGSKPDSATYSTCVESVGIEELNEIEALKIYPNPSQGHQAIEVAFSTEKQTQLYLRIYDMNGKLVHGESFRSQAGTQQHAIQPQGWAAGMYTIQLIGGGKGSAVKWIIK